ncbi:MAG: hypothetical protein DRG27_06465 [Deltaproteobacteria bacterium]|nr:MAG: hypothetical protein DRG27_06465 [Deltaproteobacteria bacterium]
MKVLKNAPDEMVFYLRDGRTLKNIKELLDALYDMHDDVFYHHVSNERNDFCNWINDVFGYKKLATQLKRIKTRDGTIKKIKLTIVAELKNKKAKPKAKAVKRKAVKRTIKKKPAKKKAKKKKIVKKKVAKKKPAKNKKAAKKQSGKKKK